MGNAEVYFYIWVSLGVMSMRPMKICVKQNYNEMSYSIQTGMVLFTSQYTGTHTGKEQNI